VLTQSAQPSLPIVEIKVFLLRKGLDQPTVARQLGITKQYLNDILHGKRKALHIRNRMVEELGFPPQLINWKQSEDLAA
jgi:transcriptional regulator with XRE-family HTH domain